MYKVFFEFVNFALAAASLASVTSVWDTMWCWRHLPCLCRRHCSIRIRRRSLTGTFLPCSCAFASNLHEGVNHEQSMTWTLSQTLDGTLGRKYISFNFPRIGGRVYSLP
ncbi:hypothetical protein PV04_06744 [Phialophora macrospora]|uniref:Uncharacterized protein n=1 Tax=Phialophora macrospora TaxID=1851006 RepID=A0A0D2FLC7_9EURO|nr:hypothetical protein PV04_06744 [Phialophora macrospora]